MKFLALLLSLCLTMNVLAASGTVSELEKALDDYQYAITVEWDQKDNAFYEAQSKAFFSKMSSLMVEKGLTKEEILSLAEKKMANKQSLEALKLKLNLMGSVKSSEELAKALKEVSKDMYGQGANWNGSGGEVLMYVGIALLIGYSIWFSATHECVEWEERYSCSTNDYCNYYATDWDGISYCASYSSETVCGWDDVCTRYERKD